MFKCFCVGEVGDATLPASLAKLSIQYGEGCGFSAVTGTDEVQKHLIHVMDAEGDAATICVIFGEVDLWIAVDVWVGEGVHWLDLG